VQGVPQPELPDLEQDRRGSGETQDKKILPVLPEAYGARGEEKIEASLAAFYAPEGIGGESRE
jgi:hypothetical protein